MNIHDILDYLTLEQIDELFEGDSEWVAFYELATEDRMGTEIDIIDLDEYREGYDVIIEREQLHELI